MAIQSRNTVSVPAANIALLPVAKDRVCTELSGHMNTVTEGFANFVVLALNHRGIRDPMAQNAIASLAAARYMAMQIAWLSAQSGCSLEETKASLYSFVELSLGDVTGALA